MHTVIRILVPAALAARLLFAMEPKDIMEKVRWQNSAQDDQVRIDMKLVDAKGDVKERKAISSSKRKAGDKPELSRLIRFQAPPEMAKAGVLTLENEKGDADQWIFIPAVFTSRRIASANRGDRYMGTDFSYEDVVAIKVDQYAFKSLGEEKVEGETCAIIEQVPVDGKLKQESGYARIVNWVDPKRSILLKAEYYDKAGALWKRYQAKDVKKYGAYFRADHAEMQDLKSNHRTIIEYLDRKVDAGVPANLFTVRSLERGP